MTTAPPVPSLRDAATPPAPPVAANTPVLQRRPAFQNAISPYWMAHAVLPALALAVLSYLLMQRGLDFQVADALYGLQGGAWRFQKTYLAENLIHIAGRNISVLAWLAVAVAWGASHCSKAGQSWRRPLLYLMLASLAGVALSSGLKATSNMDCPWDLARYGGAREFFGLLQSRPAHLPRGGCFPAGHASAGYAWLSLYFFLGQVWPRYRWHGLALGAFAGLLFGVSQQLRGAHFLSHDVWTAALCWFAALGLHALMLAERAKPLPSCGEPGDGR